MVSFEPVNTNGRVIWITGLSGAGKTTLAEKIVLHLKQHSANVVMLDGDLLRDVFAQSHQDGRFHDKHSRLSLAMQYSKLCQLLALQGLTVVIATISLFHEVHQWNRQHLPSYLEIYLQVPITELQRRDPKGLYARYHRGETSQIAGLDLAIEEPLKPDILVEFSSWQSADQVFTEVIARMHQLGY